MSNTDIYVTLGIFEATFLKSIFKLKSNVKVFVLSEPFNPISSKKKVFLRNLIGFYFRSLINDINFLCIGGTDVRDYYVSIGFKNYNYYNFGYFPNSSEFDKVLTTDKVRFIFVGQLIERKGIDLLLQALSFLDKNFKPDLWSFKIIGDGILKSKLQNEIARINNKSINYFGVIDDPLEIENLYSNSDVLFIPSTFDGWGAVVNEALSKNLAILSSGMVYGSRFPCKAWI